MKTETLATIPEKITAETCVFVDYPTKPYFHGRNRLLLEHAVENSDDTLYVLARGYGGRCEHPLYFLLSLFEIGYEIAFQHNKPFLRIFVCEMDGLSGTLKACDVLRRVHLNTAFMAQSDAEGWALIQQYNMTRDRMGLGEISVSNPTRQSVHCIVAGGGSGRSAIVLDNVEGFVPLERHTAVGGTFDQLHAGHKKLLFAAALVTTDQLTVGVTSDKMIQGKNGANQIQPMEERANQVTEYLSRVKPSLRVNIAPLSDPFGPTITDDTITGLIVSTETISGAERINSLRRDKAMAELRLFVIERHNPLHLSSTALRAKAQ